MEIKRGDIVMINFDPVQGSEQGRIRPGLVIQNNLGNIYSPLTIVLPLTTKKFETIYPTNVKIKNPKGNGEGTILTNQIRSIDKSRIIKFMMKIDEQTMKEVEKALKISLELK